MNQLRVNSTRNQLEEFKESILWNDIVNELNGWKEGFKEEMEAIVDVAANTNPSTASVLLHMGDINGRIKAVDYMLSLPDIFIGIIETQTKEKEVSDD